MPPFLPTSTYIYIHKDTYIYICIYTQLPPVFCAFMTKWRLPMVTWQFLQDAVLCGTHKHSFPNLCKRAEWFFFHRTQIYFCKNAMPLLLPLLSPPQQANIYLYPAEDEFSISTFPISPRYSRAAPGPLPELAHRQQLWWAVVLFQTLQAGKLCQSESLCLLITAVTSKPKLAIHEVTFILFPTLFLCPWLPELRFFSLLPALLVSKNRLSEVVNKTVWIQVTAKDLYYLCLSFKHAGLFWLTWTVKFSAVGYFTVWWETGDEIRCVCGTVLFIYNQSLVFLYYRVDLKQQQFFRSKSYFRLTQAWNTICEAFSQVYTF